MVCIILRVFYITAPKPWFPGVNGQHGIESICIVLPPNLVIPMPMVLIILSVFVYCCHQTSISQCQWLIWYCQCLYSTANGKRTNFSFCIMWPPNLDFPVPMVFMVLILFVWCCHRTIISPCQWSAWYRQFLCIVSIKPNFLVTMVRMVLTMFVCWCHQTLISQCQGSALHSQFLYITAIKS